MTLWDKREKETWHCEKRGLSICLKRLEENVQEATDYKRRTPIAKLGGMGKNSKMENQTL